VGRGARLGGRGCSLGAPIRANIGLPHADGYVINNAELSGTSPGQSPPLSLTRAFVAKKQVAGPADKIDYVK